MVGHSSCRTGSELHKIALDLSDYGQGTLDTRATYICAMQYVDNPYTVSAG